MRNKRLRSVVVMLLVLALGLSFMPITSVAAESTAKIAYVDGGYGIDSQGIVQSVNGQTKVDKLVYKPGMRGCADNMVIKKLVFPESVDVAFKDFKLPNCGIIEFKGNDTIIDPDYINRTVDDEHRGEVRVFPCDGDTGFGAVNLNYYIPIEWAWPESGGDPYMVPALDSDLMTHQYVIVANKDSAVWKQAEKYHLYLSETDTMRLTHDNITTRWGIKYRIALIGGFGENVQWSIADPSVATIVGDPSNGTAVITAGKKKGETTYTATCNGKTFKGTFKVERFDPYSPRVISKKRVTKTWYTDNGEPEHIWVKEGGISYSILNPKYKSYKHTKKVWKYKYDKKESAETKAMRDWVLNNYCFKEDDPYTKLDRFGSWLSAYVDYDYEGNERLDAGELQKDYDNLSDLASRAKTKKEELTYLFKRDAIWGQDPISCLERRKTVCKGVSNTVKTVCKDLGISSIDMGRPGHAWNKVLLSDGTWREIDFTAQISGCKVYEYLPYTPLFDDGLARSFTTLYAMG